MTRYEVGFMNKCAEYGLSADEAAGLMKASAVMPKAKYDTVSKLLSLGRDRFLTVPSLAGTRNGQIPGALFPQLSRGLHFSPGLKGPKGLRLFRQVLAEHGLKDGKWTRRLLRDGYLSTGRTFALNP